MLIFFAETFVANQFLYFCRPSLTDGVTGNTSDFGSEESWFDPRSVNFKSRLIAGFFVYYIFMLHFNFFFIYFDLPLWI